LDEYAKQFGEFVNSTKWSSNPALALGTTDELYTLFLQSQKGETK